MGTADQAIRDVHSTWIDAVNAGDLACLLTLVTDDVVFLTPGQAPSGRDAFAANFLAAHERLQIRCMSELEEVVVVGEVAYARARDGLVLTQRDGGEVTRLSGDRLTIYREQSDGRWLLARDAHTLSRSEN